MDSTKLEMYRTKLNERLATLMGTLDRARNEYSETVDTEPDLTDQATVDYDRNFDMRLRDRERRMLQKIRDALARIDEGTFGVCESCGDNISEKRLLARPVTTLCIECKAEAEREERTRAEEDDI
jgi:DnaK suppressor protein